MSFKLDKHFIISSRHTYPAVFKSKAELEVAVRECLRASPAGDWTVCRKYGPIANWDVPPVTDMSNMFCNAQLFKSFCGDHMLCTGKSFSGDISKWDVCVCVCVCVLTVCLAMESKSQ